MIKLFRKIRKQLIEGSKFTSYFLYAIGEILLVVVGILIALQVNTWNNESQERDKEIYYLESIKTSMFNSQTEMNRVITDAEHIGSSADTLLNLLANERYDLLDDITLDSLLFNAGDYSMISLNDAGIKEVLNTGSLDIIRDEEIRLIIASWEERIHNIRKFEQETQYLSRKYFELIDLYTDIGRWVKDEDSSIPASKKTDLFNDNGLRNYLARVSLYHATMFDLYTDQKELMDKLTRMIDEYLEQQ